MKFFSWQFPWNFKSVKELKILVIEAGSERNNIIFFFSNGTFHCYCFLILGIFFVLGIFFNILPRSYLLAIKMVPQKWDSISVAITTPTWPNHLLPMALTASQILPSHLHFFLSIAQSWKQLWAAFGRRGLTTGPFCFVISLKPGTPTLCSFQASTLLQCYGHTIPCLTCWFSPQLRKVEVKTK